MDKSDFKVRSEQEDGFSPIKLYDIENLSKKIDKLEKKINANKNMDDCHFHNHHKHHRDHQDHQDHQDSHDHCHSSKKRKIDDEDLKNNSDNDNNDDNEI